jgi:phosphopantetheinyl transferase (holo-ACP synthase)
LISSEVKFRSRKVSDVGTLEMSSVSTPTPATDPTASFAGRWAAKEAVFKALNVPGKGAGASLKEIAFLQPR